MAFFHAFIVLWQVKPVTNFRNDGFALGGTYTGDDGLSTARRPYLRTAGSGRGVAMPGVSQPALPGGPRGDTVAVEHRDLDAALWSTTRWTGPPCRRRRWRRAGGRGGRTG